MRLPSDLQQAIARQTERHDARSLAHAASTLSDRYREANFVHAAMRGPIDYAAYIAVRMPATYAAVSAALGFATELAPEVQIRSVLDLGAGPGTASWASAERFPALERVVCVERDGHLVQLGRELMAESEHEALRNTEWHTTALEQSLPEGQFDLVVLSYSLGELASKQTDDVLRKAWKCTRQWLAVIEPGTKPGFANVARARELLIAEGAHLLAPCPHELRCPMQSADKSDWCHFSVRVERSGEHRRLKSGELGYEDEKFSYVIVGREECARAANRIVRHPMRHSGYTQLELCTPVGLRKKTVTRSQKDDWRKVRKADWGDGWD
ncbi:MAG TPA: small ribosomal subunit Rsm22 family protein [Terriglobales bacterium]